MCNPSSWSDLTFCNDFLLPPFTLFLLHHHHHASFRGGLSFQCSLLVEGSSIPRQDETTHPRNYPISGEKTPRYPAGCWYMGRCSSRFPITGGARMAQFLRLTPSSSFVQGEEWTFLLFRLETRCVNSVSNWRFPRISDELKLAMESFFPGRIYSNSSFSGRVRLDRIVGLRNKIWIDVYFFRKEGGWALIIQYD